MIRRLLPLPCKCTSIPKPQVKEEKLGVQETLVSPIGKYHVKSYKNHVAPQSSSPRNGVKTMLQSHQVAALVDEPITTAEISSLYNRWRE